jgi:mono/diheme cytochrome c family protein
MRKWTVIGLITTAIIALTLPIYALNEPGRMANTQAKLLTESIERGQMIYAETCAACHSADGQGLSTVYPGLNNQGIQEMDYGSLFKIVERGRYNTAMPAWGVDEGGGLNEMQIDQLIAVLQDGDWAETAETVERLRASSSTVVSVQTSEDISTEDTLAENSSTKNASAESNNLPDEVSANIASTSTLTANLGQSVFAAKCASCHGIAGEGTALTPALNDHALRSEKTDADLLNIISNGVPGTLMIGWNQTLSEQEINELVSLIRGSFGS